MFELGDSIGNISGDFFMGLSGEIDPTKDLPPITRSEGGCARADVEEGVVDCPMGRGKEPMENDGDPVPGGVSDVNRKEPVANLFEDVTMLDTAGESKSSLRCVSGSGGSVKTPTPIVGSGGFVGVSGGGHARPKKLVPARRLGLMNREDVRQAQQARVQEVCSEEVIYVSSSEDEYEVNPETGERRRRVGFLFKAAPRPIFPGFLTADDQWKLDGCTFQRRAERAERVAGLVRLHDLPLFLVLITSWNMRVYCDYFWYCCRRLWGKSLD